MITLVASDFATRSDLENKVRNLLGLTPEPKVDYEIRGKAKDLARLQLSSRTTFWGIGCVAEDEAVKPPPSAELKAMSRGEVQPGGLNKTKKK